MIPRDKMKLLPQIYLLCVGIFCLTTCFSVLHAHTDDQGSTESNKKSSASSKFVPTHEWQTIPEGQGIPPGLHVRIDMQTGKKEAKLLDEDDSSQATTTSPSSALISTDIKSEEPEEPPSSQSSFDHAEIKEALKKIKNDAKESLSDEQEKSEGFRSYEEIKEALKEVDLNIKTEYEIVKDLVTRYSGLEGDPEKALSVLNDLEFYVHQYDNALDFIKMGGFKNIILPAMNSSNSELRSAAVFLLGSACQSNPKAQIAAIEIGALPHLIRLVSLDSSSEVRNRALYAISSVVRHFPLAQKILVESGGISAFSRTFLTDSADLLKLQLKIVTLLSDIVTERTMAVRQLQEAQKEPEDHQNSTENPVEAKKMLAEKVHQYEEVGLETVLVEQGFCRLFPRLLTQLRGEDKKTKREDLSSVQGRPLREEHDVVEKVVQAMLSVSGPCRNEFRSFSNLIQTLKERYEALSIQEKADPSQEESLFYTQLHVTCNQLHKEIYRDEL